MANYLRKGLTREQYKAIKRKDHKQMETLLTEIYNEGRNDGINAAKEKRIAPADIEKTIAGVKGIGAAKVAAIMERIYKLYEEVK